MRCVSLVDRIKFEFTGNVHKDGIALGDVDCDSCNELIVGNLAGTMAIFKGSECKPWAISTNLGMISSVIVGDIINANKNCVVSISTEGSLFVFNVFDNLVIREEAIKAKSPSVSCGEEATEAFRHSKFREPLYLKPFHSQKLPANTKAALLADIDNDGQVELIVCLTDRVIRTYRWVKVNEVNGKLVGIHKWEFADQIGTISLNPSEDENGVNIIVSQPGGTYAKLECWGKKKSKYEKGGDCSIEVICKEATNDDCDEKISNLTPIYFELDSAKMRNRSISTEVVGGVHGLKKDGKSCNCLLAVATIDGTLMLVDEQDILWSLQVDHQVFALSKLDVIDEGRDELIACAWDGQTYIVNPDRSTVRFDFEEPVSAFIAGYFNVNPENPGNPNVPCLVYATFNNTIHLYYNVKLNPMKPNNLRDIIDKETVADIKELHQLMNISDFGIDSFCSKVLNNFPCFAEECDEDTKETSE